MEETSFLEPPAKFEAGSQMIAQVAGWGAAVRYLDKLGMANVAAHDRALTERILEGMGGIPGVRVLGPTDTRDRLGAVSFVVDGVHPHDVSQVLDADGIAIRVGHHCAQPVHRRLGVHASARVSVSVYNTGKEVDFFLDRLARVREFFGVRHG